MRDPRVADPTRARLFAVADAFDAMTHDHPYRAAMKLELALAEIKRGAGTKFEPLVVDATSVDGRVPGRRMNNAELSLLLIEDDALATSWVRMALEGSGIRLAGVPASAAAAPILAERRHTDVLLVDYRLPDGRGTELVRDLRRGITVPAVLMSANEEQGFNEAAREAGAQGTVLKTGSARELVQAILRVHGGHEAYDPRHPQRERGRSSTRSIQARRRGCCLSGW